MYIRIVNICVPQLRESVPYGEPPSAYHERCYLTATQIGTHNPPRQQSSREQGNEKIGALWQTSEQGFAGGYIVQKPHLNKTLEIKAYTGTWKSDKLTPDTLPFGLQVKVATGKLVGAPSSVMLGEKCPIQQTLATKALLAKLAYKIEV